MAVADSMEAAALTAAVTAAVVSVANPAFVALSAPWLTVCARG